MADPGEHLSEHESLRRQQAKDARPWMNLQQIHSWVDVEIEQAQRRGDFDNLHGAGKPLKNVEQSDPDWWVKQLIEREKLDMSAALPTVMALRQERRSYPQSLVRLADEVAVRERLEDYNARVLEDRRRPVVGPNSPAVAPRVDVEEMVTQWRALRAESAQQLANSPVPAPDGALERDGAGSGPPVPAWALIVIFALVGTVLLWAILR